MRCLRGCTTAVAFLLSLTCGASASPIGRIPVIGSGSYGYQDPAGGIDVYFFGTDQAGDSVNVSFNQLLLASPSISAWAFSAESTGFGGIGGGGFAMINGVYSTTFLFSLGGGEGRLQLFDQNSGAVLAEADLSSYLSVRQTVSAYGSPDVPPYVQGSVSISPVPEPATLPLVVSGIAAIIHRSRKMRPRC